jgi:hypothetical protein
VLIETPKRNFSLVFQKVLPKNQKGEYTSMSDLAEYDYFATQFGNSLKQEGTTGNGNWFGRLVKFHQNNEFQLINFFGTNYTESEFRDALANDTVVVKDFSVSNINYTADVNNPLYATVTADVHIEATIGLEEKQGDFTITHNLKQTWQTYETVIS